METTEDPNKRRLRVGSRSIPLPDSLVARVGIGIALVIGGILGALPILGFWMIPLGLVVLSNDIPVLRRWRRRLEVRFGRWRQRRKFAAS